MRFLILLVAVAAACAGDAQHDRPATVVRDSAGITIVENPDVSTANLPTWDTPRFQDVILPRVRLEGAAAR